MTYRSIKIISSFILLLGLCSVSSAADEKSSKDMTIVPDANWNCGMPDGIASPEKGTVVFTAEMNLDAIYNVGQTQYGQRQVLVVKDGTITGEKFTGTVMPGGLDFELTLSNKVVEIEQVLVLRDTDGKYIYARNAGVGADSTDIRVVMDFEAPNDSKSAWLNSGKYVAKRTVDPAAKKFTLTVYDVSAAPTAEKLSITKPAGVPAQSWDYRKAAPGEKAGEQIIDELVTLGASTSVGASKRGPRNIIPITGGELKGLINGKVPFGGADYQNLGNPATIDARYLWQADNGEIIIVRNAGAFGSLVPTFEAKVDGKFAWLNSGTYLSSNPGMGNGGVRLTMNKSSN